MNRLQQFWAAMNEPNPLEVLYNEAPSEFIGCMRIMLAVYCHMVKRSDPIAAILGYILFAELHPFGALLARKHGLYSRFGAILNHMVDRIAFIGLLMHLCERYHGYEVVFLQLVALINFSTFVLTIHANDQIQPGSHSELKNWIVRDYYHFSGRRLLLGCVCDSFYLIMYGLAYFENEDLQYIFQGLWYPTVILAMGKAIVCVYQLVISCLRILEFDRINSFMAQQRRQMDQALQFE